MNWYKKSQSEEIPTAERTILSVCELIYNILEKEQTQNTEKQLRNFVKILQEYTPKLELPLKSSGNTALFINTVVPIIDSVNLDDPHHIGNKITGIIAWYDAYKKCDLEKILSNRKTAQASKINVWVDDIHAPPEGWNWLWAKNYDEAIAYLKTGNVEKMSLDHDLGDETQKNGHDIAKFVEEAAYFNRIPRIEFGIHTDNPVGRDRMAAAIKNAYRYWEQNEGNGNELV